MKNWQVQRRKDRIESLIIFLCVIGCEFFTYLPFLYIIKMFPMSKNALFIALIGVTVWLLLFYFVTVVKKLNQQMFSLWGNYLFFAFYAICNFVLFSGHFNNDIFTVRTLGLTNPIFAMFGIFCIRKKRLLIQILLGLSSIYIFFTLSAVLRGDIQMVSSLPQNIFDLETLGIEGRPYQNINFYLGIFIVLTIAYLFYIQPLWRLVHWVGYALAGGIFALMFLIGGRGAIVAVIGSVGVALIFKFFRGSLAGKFRLFFLLAVIMILLLLSYDSLLRFLESSIAVKRFVRDDGQMEDLRWFLYVNAFELFMASGKNLIFGAGINSFSAYIEMSLVNHPHNILLELLCEYGIVGFLLFFMPIGKILMTRKRYLENIYATLPEEQILFIIYIYLWIIQMFSGGLRGSWRLIFFTYLLIPSDLRKLPAKEFATHHQRGAQQDV